MGQPAELDGKPDAMTDDRGEAARSGDPGATPADSLHDLGWAELLDRLEATLETSRSLSGRATGPVRDEMAWNEFSRRVWQYVALAGRWNTRLGAADLEDIAQDLLVQFLSPKGLRQLRSARAPGPYLLSAARNRVLNLIRHERRAGDAISTLGRELGSGVEIEDASSTGAVVDATVEHDDLRWALARLSPGDRNLLRDRFWRSLAITEIAQERGLSYSAVAVRISGLYERFAWSWAGLARLVGLVSKWMQNIHLRRQCNVSLG
jgi:RNA polymerase sigma factor (sigma-70 family)